MKSNALAKNLSTIDREIIQLLSLLNKDEKRTILTAWKNSNEKK